MKRIISLILALVLALSTLPAAPVQAAETDDIRTAVTEAYNELLSITSPGEGGASDGAMQLLSHALFGGGEDLIMDENDNFTGMLLRSGMYKDGFIEAMTIAFHKLLRNYDNQMLVSFNLNYYEHKMNYGASEYRAFGDFPELNGSAEDSTAPDPNRLGTLVGPKDWTGTNTTHDDALVLVVGSANTHITIRKTGAANQNATYNISVVFGDNFDFGSGNYEGSNTHLATALTWFGRLMQLGAVVKTYHFEVHLEFDITFDNHCPHQTENFRWELVSEDRNIVAVSGDSLTENATTKVIDINSETGEELSPFFSLTKPAHLNHDRPWVLEYRGKNCWLILCPTLSFSAGEPYLFMTSNYFAGGICHLENGIDEETGEEATLSVREGVGINYSALGYRNSQYHVYRLENRINPDGSNMVYLFIDGEALGPINNRMKVINFDVTYFNETEDWFNGKDIRINYIYNRNTRLYPSHVFDYLQVWENGEGNAPYSYYTTSTVAPTCTGKGYTAHVCSQCGDTVKDNFVDPLGHRFGSWTAKDDTLHSRSCSVCGEEAVDAHSFADGACTVCGYANHASVEGAWTTDLIMSAADLGVSAPDSVIRATLTFGADGSASTGWEAVELTALRIFFHDMFVNAYYALGYGLGITNFEEIEILCREETGMSVSDYMDTIVTEEAISAAFTPAPTTGTYTYNHDHTAIFTDLAIMDVPADPTVEGSFVVGNDTLYLNAAPWGKPDYTFICTK